MIMPRHDLNSWPCTVEVFITIRYSVVAARLALGPCGYGQCYYYSRVMVVVEKTVSCPAVFLPWSLSFFLLLFSREWMRASKVKSSWPASGYLRLCSNPCRISRRRLELLGRTEKENQPTTWAPISPLLESSQESSPSRSTWPGRINQRGRTWNSQRCIGR